VQTLAEIREILQSRGLAPRKSLGQNFLIDHNLIRKLVDAAALEPPPHTPPVILEVGPGTGTLTEELLGRGAHVIACELDRGLAELLRERFAEPQRAIGAPPEARFTLIEGDALATKRALNPDILDALAGRPFRLISNLPYAAGTPVILTLLIDHPECSGLFVTIQREVADRLTAGPGTKEYGPLAVVAQAVADVHRLAALPPECFWPRPEVTSAMVALVRKEHPLTGDDPNAPRKLAEAAQRLFAARRKQLGSLLGRGFDFPQGIAPEARAERLSLHQILALAARMG
jgi:16S rRNA (adenine1518-N6/adenine1519-N6)-dimethyltransferase